MSTFQRLFGAEPEAARKGGQSASNYTSLRSKLNSRDPGPDCRPKSQISPGAQSPSRDGPPSILPLLGSEIEMFHWSSRLERR